MTDGAWEYFVLFLHKSSSPAPLSHRKPGIAQDKRKDGRYGRACPAGYCARPERKVALWICGERRSAGTLTVTDDWSGCAGRRKRGYDQHAIAECGDPEVVEDFLPIIHLETWLTPEEEWVGGAYCRAPLDSLFDV